jgi:hypothetical protein
VTEKDPLLKLADPILMRSPADLQRVYVGSSRSQPIVFIERAYRTCDFRCPIILIVYIAILTNSATFAKAIIHETRNHENADERNSSP